MKKIAVIGANEPLRPFYRQAKALGYYIVGIAWAQGAVCKEYCDKFYPVSFKEKDEVLRICKEEKVDGITSFNLESALPTVIYVAQNLGLVSNSFDCIKLTENKFAQRETFAQNGIPVPFYRKYKKTDTVNTEEFKFPVIVKPVDSGGSQGITKLESPEGLSKAMEEAFDRSWTEEAIIEEFIDGREFSVEYLSHNGKHYHIQITDKVTSGAPHFIEMQHHQPADISAELAQRIREMVEKALTALKITNSPSHTEIKLNSCNELYIIEIGARMGGDYITSDLVRLSTGYDMVKGSLELATGCFEKPVFGTTTHSGVFFYSKLAPHIGDVILNHEKYPEIVEWEYNEGDLPEAKSNADRNGYFLYQSNCWICIDDKLQRNSNQ